jgi:opacity protein-like surface antigen
MRKLLISALLLGAATAATPAAAQYSQRGYDYNQRGYGYDDRTYRDDDRIDQQIAEIRDRIRRAADRRQITRREAERLLYQADQIDRLEDRYSRDGLSRWELQDLRSRVQDLRQQLRFERHDDRYDDGYGGGYRDDSRIDLQIRQLEQRIQFAAQQRRISPREADRLLSEARQIDRLENQYSRNGLTQWEVQDLRMRIQRLRQQFRWERQDGDNRRW